MYSMVGVIAVVFLLIGGMTLLINTDKVKNEYPEKYSAPWHFAYTCGITDDLTTFGKVLYVIAIIIIGQLPWFIVGMIARIVSWVIIPISWAVFSTMTRDIEPFKEYFNENILHFNQIAYQD